MCLLCSVHMVPWEHQLRWLSQAATFLAGNAWRSWDSKEAGGRAGSQKTCRDTSTNLACPCRILLFWHFSDGKFLFQLRSSATFGQRASSLPGWMRPFPCCLNRSAAQSRGCRPGTLLWWGRAVSLTLLVPSLRPWESAPGN